MTEREENIVTVGGGTGSPTVNRSLLLAGAKHIDAIAAMYDNGGHTGKRRLRREELDFAGQEVAYSDALRIMISLIDPNNDPQAEVLNRWFTHRNKLNEVAGYGLADNWFNSEDAFKQIESDINTLNINLMGTVLPSSTTPANIRFMTEHNPKNGYRGEYFLDVAADAGSTDMVVGMVLEPNVPAYPRAKEALENASIVFLSCGSVHGSVACNFLPEGMQEAIIGNKNAKVYLVTNLTSTSNETHEYTPIQYVRLMEKFVGEGRINGIIIPEISRRQFEQENKNIAVLYNQENSHFMGWEQEELYRAEEEGVQIVTHKAINIVDVPEKGKKIVRHSPEELSPVLSTLLEENLRK